MKAKVTIIIVLFFVSIVGIHGINIMFHILHNYKQEGGTGASAVPRPGNLHLLGFL